MMPDSSVTPCCCRAAVACVADSHNVVMVTTANWHYLDFVRNWVHHVRQANISNFLVCPFSRWSGEWLSQALRP
jgi:hypothetical protein